MDDAQQAATCKDPQIPDACKRGTGIMTYALLPMVMPEQYVKRDTWHRWNPVDVARARGFMAALGALRS